MLRVLSLEKELSDERSKRQPTSTGEIEKIQAEAQLRESRLQATVASLERELLVALGAKKKSSGVNDITREAFRAKIAGLEKELHESNKKRAAAAHDLEKAKTDAFIVESQLQGKISDLERELPDHTEGNEHTNSVEYNKLEEENRSLTKELLESNKKNSELSNELENIKRESASKLDTIDGIEDTKSRVKDLEEENKDIKLMNSSLQDHIKKLKEKCNKLEQSLADAKDENEDLMEQLKSAAQRRGQDSNIKERHRELQAEFQKLWVRVQNIPKEREGQLSKKMTEDYEQRVQALRDIITNNHSSHEQALGALIQKQNALKSENKALKKEIERLNNDTKQLTSNSIAAENTSKELAEVTQKANTFKVKLSKLEEEYDSLKTNNASLREIIMKNNSTFTAKVEALRKERDEFKKEIASSENYNSTDSVAIAAPSGSPVHPSSAASIQQLSDRVNTVASYLISISEIQKRIAKSPEVKESRQDDGSSVTSAGNFQFREVNVHEQAMLQNFTMDDRINILQGVDDLRKSEDEIMEAVGSESHRDLLGASLQAQHRVLEEIQAEIGARQR